MSKNDYFSSMTKAGPLRVKVIKSGYFPQYRNQDYTIIRIARERWGTNTGIHPHTSHFLRFLLVLNGSCQIRSSRENSYAGPGTLIIIPPDHHNQLWVVSESDLEHYILDMDGKKVMDFLISINLAGPTILPLNDSEEIEHLFSSITTHAARVQKRYWRIAHLYIPILFELILMNRRQQPYQDSTAIQHYKRCRAYIETHFRTISHFKEVAHACHLHHDYLTRVFQDCSGESPGAYIRRLKMAYAARLLLHSGKNISELALHLGYSDVFAFSKAFKHNYGLSPRNWKKQFL